MVNSTSSLNVGFEEIQKLLSLVELQTKRELRQVYQRCEEQEALLLDLANSMQTYFSVANPQQRKLEAVYETQLLIIGENSHASKSYQRYKSDVHLSKNKIEEVLDKLEEFFSLDRMIINNSVDLSEGKSPNVSFKEQRLRTNEMDSFELCRQPENEESSIECITQNLKSYKRTSRDTSPIQRVIASRNNDSLYQNRQQPFISSNSFNLNETSKQKFNGPSEDLLSSTDNKDDIRDFSSFLKSDNYSPLLSSTKNVTLIKDEKQAHENTLQNEDDELEIPSSDNPSNVSLSLDLSQERMTEHRSNTNEIMTKQKQFQDHQKKNAEIKNLVYEKSPKLEQTVNYARLAKSVSFLPFKDKKNRMARRSRKKKTPPERRENGDSYSNTRSKDESNPAERHASPIRHCERRLSTLEGDQEATSDDKENQHVQNPKLRNIVSENSSSLSHHCERIKPRFNNEYSNEWNFDDNFKESTTILRRGHSNDSAQQIYAAENNHKNMVTLDFKDWNI
ncbi:hypothetical protein SPOG_00258 [Schizosaccharomyces cryophilus OY26]|uniref:Uncharacterized protein n=1 Tax=Schizosaccharomyces cryophilus (strain OY26 / ATCC MYA-4695 / CBS 11777 / NBRC 106824 / NRRL Y48691) TaxID=653667 RepID=S9W1H2_SCHCR|nr:uncharacterized protein SPOG_00258 [Schizosaccharomyces cryophilus OY26]EPY51835.1 hypothetical protein SPOG_00258 [Schizosaccharomyces cryophilus OY26]